MRLYQKATEDKLLQDTEEVSSWYAWLRICSVC